MLDDQPSEDVVQQVLGVENKLKMVAAASTDELCTKCLATAKLKRSSPARRSRLTLDLYSRGAIDDTRVHNFLMCLSRHQDFAAIT